MTFSFAGDLGFWISEDWFYVKQTMHFRHLGVGDHEGKAAAVGFADGLSERGALKKICIPIQSHVVCGN